MPNARDIPWPRLIAESSAIVISILLAFSIDAWWTERQETVREERQIQALIAEFEAIVALLTMTLIDFVKSHQTSTN